jgi:hypothetical protein
MCWLHQRFFFFFGSGFFTKSPIQSSFFFGFFTSPSIHLSHPTNFFSKNLTYLTLTSSTDMLFIFPKKVNFNFWSKECKMVVFNFLYIVCFFFFLGWCYSHTQSLYFCTNSVEISKNEVKFLSHFFIFPHQYNKWVWK